MAYPDRPPRWQRRNPQRCWNQRWLPCWKRCVYWRATQLHCQSQFRRPHWDRLAIRAALARQHGPWHFNDSGQQHQEWPELKFKASRQAEYNFWEDWLCYWHLPWVLNGQPPPLRHCHEILSFYQHVEPVVRRLWRHPAWEDAPSATINRNQIRCRWDWEWRDANAACLRTVFST